MSILSNVMGMPDDELDKILNDFVGKPRKEIEAEFNIIKEQIKEVAQTIPEKGNPGPQGKDGRDGLDGKDGKDGRDGLNGLDGKDGRDGKDGKDGPAGEDGVSVVDANIEFDGSLVFTLSDGSEIDAGQINVFEGITQTLIQQASDSGGGASLPDQTGNAGKFLTTDGTDASWADVTAGVGVASVNGETGVVVLTASDVGAYPDTNPLGFTTNTGTVTSLDLTAGTGISVSGGPVTTSGNITVTNTAPDQIVSLTGGGATSVSGTYPSFTITSTDTNTTYTAGTGLDLTGTVFSIDSTVATLTSTQTLTNKTVEKLILNDGYTEEVFAITDGATVNLDPNNGSIQTWTLGANRTPDQANWASGQSIVLQIDDGTDYTIDWATIAPVWKTDGGTAPTLETTGVTIIVLWKVGTTIYGARVGDA